MYFFHLSKYIPIIRTEQIDYKQKRGLREDLKQVRTKIREKTDREIETETKDGET
jgi:hypothetical protein